MSSTKTAITPTRQTNFTEWYQAVIKEADLAEHSSVRGCMIIKPWGYALWEQIQTHLDRMIKETGHENVYFPMLIPLSFMQKEAAHVEGFAKECAVVTHYRLKTDSEGQLIPAEEAKLTEPYVIRPTSETVIGEAMSNWVQSYKDLPIKINQWANIMRWEMRTRLFLRTSEFLWQEGHTAHSTDKEAMDETLLMLDVYEKLARDYLALPVIKGEKTPAERFPGATHTYCIEAMMQDGKALQAGTSHFLGQNFSKAYEIEFADKDQQRQFAWTTSWGVSTRLIGAIILSHSDDDGLALPPRVASQQVVIIPVIMKPEDEQAVMDYCHDLMKALKQQIYYGSPLRVMIDKSDQRAGHKFWQAVKKGTPLRVEIGMREIAGNTLSLSRRDQPAKEKTTISRENLLANTTSLLDDIHTNLLVRAQEFQKKHTFEVHSLTELKNAFSGNENDCVGFALAFFDTAVEDNEEVSSILKELKISARCIPFKETQKSGNCIFSGNVVTTQVIFAKAY